MEDNCCSVASILDLSCWAVASREVCTTSLRISDVAFAAVIVNKDLSPNFVELISDLRSVSSLVIKLFRFSSPSSMLSLSSDVWFHSRATSPLRASMELESRSAVSSSCASTTLFRALIELDSSSSFSCSRISAALRL